MTKTHLMLAIFASLSFSTAVSALTVPYTEDFAVDNANWRSNATATFLTYVPSGGPDGSSYVTGAFNFQNNSAGDTVVLHRGNYNANVAIAGSGNNFVGNWIAAGIKEFSFMVRHNAPEALSYFTRFAKPIGSPGAVALQLGEVQPNTWTEVSFAIDANNPEFISFQNLSFGVIFDEIGILQIGVRVPAGLAGLNQSFTFDIDQVSIAVPEPASLVTGLIALGSVFALRRKIV
jgi:hypothetical protein